MSCRPTDRGQRLARACMVAMLGALPITGLGAGLAAATAHAPALRLEAPSRARVGALVRLHVVVDGAPSLGALQASLRFDEHALDVARVELRATFAGTGPVTPLSAVETPNRKLIAGFSCVAPACAATSGATADGTSVATIDVEVLQAGRIELRLDGGLLADVGGAVIAHPRPVTAYVDVAGSSRIWRATHGPALAAHGHRHGDSPDLTGDGRVTAADAQGMQRGFLRGADADAAC